MQFGEHIDHASVVVMPFMALNRLRITAALFPSGRILETGEEIFFKLNRNKGNYLQCDPILIPD